MEFLGRMFTASNSDASGMVGNKNSTPRPWRPDPAKPDRKRDARAKTKTRFGGDAGRQNMFISAESQVAKKSLLGQ